VLAARVPASLHASHIGTVDMKMIIMNHSFHEISHDLRTGTPDWHGRSCSLVTLPYGYGYGYDADSPTPVPVVDRDYCVNLGRVYRVAL